MGGQFAETLSKTHIFRLSSTPMALPWPLFSVIWGIFGEKTVFKTHFFDHRKGQFLPWPCHLIIHMSIPMARPWSGDFRR